MRTRRTFPLIDCLDSGDKTKASAVQVMTSFGKNLITKYNHKMKLTIGREADRNLNIVKVLLNKNSNS